MIYKRNMVQQFPQKGWQAATLNDMREGKPANTKYGLSDTALASFTTDNHCLVTQSFLMAPGVNFTLEKLINITMGNSDEEIDLDTLVGKRCGIKVEHKLWNDRVFENVVDVCSIEELNEFMDKKSRMPTPVIMDLDDLDFD